MRERRGLVFHHGDSLGSGGAGLGGIQLGGVPGRGVTGGLDADGLGLGLGGFRVTARGELLAEDRELVQGGGELAAEHRGARNITLSNATPVTLTGR